MDAPRIIRKDMTLVTELVAKYQGLEGALNGVGQEDAAEEIADLVVPLVNARAALEHALEALQNTQAPNMPGVHPGEDAIDAEKAAHAQQAAFDLEDAIMKFIEEHNALPAAVLIRPDIYELIQTAWPGREEVKLKGGAIKLTQGTPEQIGEAPFGFEPRS